MFKKDSETTTTVENMYTCSTVSNSEDDVLARVHTRTVNGGVPLCSLEVHVPARNGKNQVKLITLQVDQLEDLRDMLTAVVEDLAGS